MSASTSQTTSPTTSSEMAPQRSGAADPALSVRGLWKVFGPKADRIVGSPDADLPRAELLAKTGCTTAVKNVSFDVAPSEVFVVMGLSGSGKSTLVRCLTRLIEPTAGEVLLAGEDVAAMSDARLREVRRTHVSMVFQHFGLLPHRQVIDNVAYGLEIRGMKKKERHARAQEMVELGGLAGKEVIRLHHEVGKTMVFITHDLQEALKLGDRILIMRDGELVQVGTPAEVVAAPADDYVRDFVSDVPRSHVLTLRWVMRDARPGESTEGLVMSPDTVVRDAARRALDSPHPVRVMDGDRLLGVVDDDDLLRVIVAEEGAPA